jgi:hypothetical protein
MKTRIMIIEENFSRFYTTKQVIETSIKIPVQTEKADSLSDIDQIAGDFEPHVLLVSPAGGILELIRFLKNGNYNCRNSEVSMILASDLETVDAKWVEDVCNKRCAMISAAA